MNTTAAAMAPFAPTRTMGGCGSKGNGTRLATFEVHAPRLVCMGLEPESPFCLSAANQYTPVGLLSRSFLHLLPS